MSCADCAGEMVECVDCRADSAYAAAREEGRREGYAALQEQADAHRADILRMEAEYDGDMATREKRGYAACTADVVAWLEAQAKAAHELYAEVGAGSYRSRAMALEGAAGEIADGEHVGAAGKVRP